MFDLVFWLNLSDRLAASRVRSVYSFVLIGRLTTYLRRSQDRSLNKMTVSSAQRVHTCASILNNVNNECKKAAVFMHAPAHVSNNKAICIRP